SKVKDGKVEALYESSGPFKEGSVHRGRVIGYSTFDGMYLMTFEPTIIEQQFIRLEDSVSGKIAQLCLDSEKLGKVDKIATEATTVNTFQPGTVVDVLVTSTTGRGLLGKILGHLPVTADLIHSGAGPDAVDLDAKYKIGSRVKARVICTFPNAKNPKLGISLLP
ncbi:hypothetical protein BN1723_018692, partial [Verticillium longisporum]